MSISLLYQITPCKLKEIDKTHACSYRSKCKIPQQDNLKHVTNEHGGGDSSSNLDDDLSSSNYLVSSDDEEEEEDDENENKDKEELDKQQLQQKENREQEAVPAFNTKKIKNTCKTSTVIEEEANIKNDTTEIITSIMSLLILKK